MLWSYLLHNLDVFFLKAIYDGRIERTPKSAKIIPQIVLIFVVASGSHCLQCCCHLYNKEFRIPLAKYHPNFKELQRKRLRQRLFDEFLWPSFTESSGYFIFSVWHPRIVQLSLCFVPLFDSSLWIFLRCERDGCIFVFCCR